MAQGDYRILLHGSSGTPPVRDAGDSLLALFITEQGIELA